MSVSKGTPDNLTHDSGTIAKKGIQLFPAPWSNYMEKDSHFKIKRHLNNHVGNIIAGQKVMVLL